MDRTTTENTLPLATKARFAAGRLSRIFFAACITFDVLSLACLASVVFAFVLFLLMFAVLVGTVGLILLIVPGYWTFLSSGAIWDFAAGAIALSPIFASVGIGAAVVSLLLTIPTPAHMRNKAKTIFLIVDAVFFTVALIVITVGLMHGNA